MTEDGVISYRNEKVKKKSSEILVPLSFLLTSPQRMTKEGHPIEEIEPALCAYNPTACVKLIRRIFRQAEAREKPALWPLAIKPTEYASILGPAERASIRRAWEKFRTECGQWNDTDQHTESFLLRLV